MANLAPLSVHVTDQILAALAESDLPMSTAQVMERTGCGYQYGQLTYRMLQRLARRGEVERMRPEAGRSVYWRRIAPAGPAACMACSPLDDGPCTCRGDCGHLCCTGWARA